MLVNMQKNGEENFSPLVQTFCYMKYNQKWILRCISFILIHFYNYEIIKITHKKCICYLFRLITFKLFSWCSCNTNWYFILFGRAFLFLNNFSDLKSNRLTSQLHFYSWFISLVSDLKLTPNHYVHLQTLETVHFSTFLPVLLRHFHINQFLQ